MKSFAWRTRPHPCPISKSSPKENLPLCDWRISLPTLRMLSLGRPCDASLIMTPFQNFLFFLFFFLFSTSFFFSLSFSLPHQVHHKNKVLNIWVPPHHFPIYYFVSTEKKRISPFSKIFLSGRLEGGGSVNCGRRVAPLEMERRFKNAD